jgi:branched-chain amino acid transport system ATP-binding protein
LTQSLLQHIKDLRTEGMTVVFVEHDMDVVYDISDWVVVLAEGRIIAEGPPDSIGTNPLVIDAYLGRHHDAPASEAEEARQLFEAAEEIADEIGVSIEDVLGDAIVAPAREPESDG